MDAHEHEHYRELAALFALDALSPEDQAACAGHLAACAECAADVRAFRGVAGALAHVPAQTPPPPALRARVLASVVRAPGTTPALAKTAPTPRHAGAAWLAAAASIALALLTIGYAAQLRGRLALVEDRLREALLRAESSEQQVAALRTESAEARAQLVVLAAPDVARVDLTGQAVAPSAMARAFWSRSRGLVFTATDLPTLPAGRSYQLWVVTARAPVSAGLVRPDPTGRVNAVFQTPVDMLPPVAMALTDEPEGGVPAPTGTRYLVGTPGP